MYKSELGGSLKLEMNCNNKLHLLLSLHKNKQLDKVILEKNPNLESLMPICDFKYPINLLDLNINEERRYNDKSLSSKLILPNILSLSLINH